MISVALEPSLPTDSATIIYETVSAVLRFRKRFEDMFEAARKCTDPARVAALPPAQKAMYARAKTSELKIQQFADTFVFYCPIGTSYGDASIMDTFQMIGACCLAMQLSLVDKTPLRGAITIGWAVEIKDKTIYGPALVEAYDLERNVANYPRVVVSPKVRALLAPGQKYSSNKAIADAMTGVAGEARAFLWEDIDGCWIVDFLGQQARHAFDKLEQAPEIVKGAYAFVRSEAEQFRQEGKYNLALRYHILQQYIESRLPLWGLEPVQGS